MITLERSPESVTKIRLAWQKTRSIAAEGGYLDLLPDLDWATGDERTLDMLMAYETGRIELDGLGWMNLCILVEHSPPWNVGLAAQGYELPDRKDLIAQVAS